LMSPLAAVASLLLLYLLARELDLSRIGSLAAVAMFASVTVFSFYAVQPMSDVVAAAWAIATVLLALKSRRHPNLAFAAGFAFGAGLLYCFYGPYEAWWYTRYLLPGIPALPLAAVMLAESLLSRLRERADSRSGAAVGALRTGRVAAAITFLVICFVGIRLGRRYDVLDIGRSDSIYRDGIHWAAARVPKNALVVAMQFSGAMKAYCWGKLVRWEWMEGKNFPEFRRRMEAAGYVFYALTYPEEVPEVAARLPGSWKNRGSYRQATLWELN
ncbi:MAG: hypothetical protein M3R34_03980, partial [Acidobacteriota bacterium]|nr:hypothetical protein [Acidobacteriota bacterium]